MTERLQGCSCGEACRCVALQAALQALIDAEDARRAAERDYERAVIAARGLVHLDVGNRRDGRLS
jgi:hypothetical protein